MTTYDNSSRMEVQPACATVLDLCSARARDDRGGILVLGDIMLVTLISTIFIGWVSIFAGAFEIVHAFWTKGWGGFRLAGASRHPVHRVRRRAGESAGRQRADPHLRPRHGAADFRYCSHPARYQPLARSGLDHAAVRNIRRIGRSRDPDGISDDGIVGPRIPARRRSDISWDRLAGLRVAAEGENGETAL